MRCFEIAFFFLTNAVTLFFPEKKYPRVRFLAAGPALSFVLHSFPSVRWAKVRLVY